jgi:hypothetical protein
VISATLPESFCAIVLSGSGLGMINLIPSRSSSQSAINFEARARDKSGFRAGEIRDHASHLGTLSIATEGSHLGHPYGKVSICGVYIGVNRPRLDVVDCDAARSQIADKTTSETGDRPIPSLTLMHRCPSVTG